MLDLSIGELAHAIEGDLCLGTMPPLGGACEPAGRIVTDPHDLRPGDIFWELDDPQGARNLRAEEAFLRGARGTVTARRYVEPWAGCFSICVRDGRESLGQLARWARSRFSGGVVLFAGPSAAHTARGVHNVLSTVLHGACQATLPDADAAALTLIHSSSADGYLLIALPCDTAQDFSRISHLCCPSIIVINLPHKTHASPCGWIPGVAKRSWRFSPSLVEPIVLFNEEYAERHPGDRQGSISDRCTIRHGSCGLSDNARRASEQMFSQEEDTRSQLATGRAIARLLGVPEEHLAAASGAVVSRELTEKREPMKVPSSASALREDDAALPPGLERHTC